MGGDATRAGEVVRNGNAKIPEPGRIAVAEVGDPGVRQRLAHGS